MENKNIHQKILAIMAEVDYIQKGDKKVNNQYKFVGHDQVSAVFHKKFVEHGIISIPTVIEISQDGNRTQIMLNVKFINVDNPQDVLSVDFPGYGVDGGDKGPGKAISYAYKYALLKTFCLETGDDPDNDANAKHENNSPITTVQIARLNNLLGSNDELREKIELRLKDLGYEDYSQIPQSKYKEIITFVEAKIKEGK